MMSKRQNTKTVDEAGRQIFFFLKLWSFFKVDYRVKSVLLVCICTSGSNGEVRNFEIFKTFGKRIVG